MERKYFRDLNKVSDIEGLLAIFAAIKGASVICKELEFQKLKVRKNDAGALQIHLISLPFPTKL